MKEQETIKEELAFFLEKNVDYNRDAPFSTGEYIDVLMNQDRLKKSMVERVLQKLPIEEKEKLERMMQAFNLPETYQNMCWENIAGYALQEMSPEDPDFGQILYLYNIYKSMRHDSKHNSQEAKESLQTVMTEGKNAVNEMLICRLAGTGSDDLARNYATTGRLSKYGHFSSSSSSEGYLRLSSSGSTLSDTESAEASEEASTLSPRM